MTAKRSIDLALAWVGLVALSPIAVVMAAAIKLETKGPAIFIQARVGKDQKSFKCLKFRTMRHGIGGPLWTDTDDPRVTKVGRFIRAWHLDELPQLINVIRGEMSIVGPRPIVEHEAALFGALQPPYNARFNVAPGITGLAQIGVAPDAHSAKFRLDVFYVEHQSLGLDLLIMLRTILFLGRIRKRRRLMSSGVVEGLR